MLFHFQVTPLPKAIKWLSIYVKQIKIYLEKNISEMQILHNLLWGGQKFTVRSGKVIICDTQ